MKKFMLITLFFSLFTFMNACSYNVSMAHTQGTADDVIDDTMSNTPTVSPTLTVPISPK